MATPPPAVQPNTNAVPDWANPANHPINSEVGQTAVQRHEEELFSAYSTLDEPVLETVLRDVRAVGAKLRVVMMPLDRAPIYAALSSQDSSAEETEGGEPELSENDRQVLQQLKDWDLWGPLVLCLALGILLSFRAPTDQASLVFAAVFLAVWVGGTVVTINAQLLGGTISFFQSLCVLGYSIFPMVIAALVIFFLPVSWLWLNLILVVTGFLWTTRTSSFFISLYIKPERRFLALYPMFFLYTFLGWMILLF